MQRRTANHFLEGMLKVTLVGKIQQITDFSNGQHGILQQTLGFLQLAIENVLAGRDIGTDTSGISAAMEAARQADVVIACVGGKNGLGKMATSGEGVDSACLDLPGGQEQLIRGLYQANPNLVIIHTDGRPLCSEWAYQNAAAIVEAWLPNTYGGAAVAEVLTGEYNPAGRLPVDVPKTAGHQPVFHYQNHNSSTAKDRAIIDTGYIDSSVEVLAPFGYGLSYTEFAYSDFRVEINPNGQVTAQVAVENTGSRDGEEVVQLYGSDLRATMIRPIQELVGFKRVPLKAGERKDVVFSFDIDFFAFTDPAFRWIVENGEFAFFVGSNSDDHRAEGSVVLDRTRAVEPNKRCFYAAAEVI